MPVPAESAAKLRACMRFKTLSAHHAKFLFCRAVVFLLLIGQSVVFKLTGLATVFVPLVAVGRSELFTTMFASYWYNSALPSMSFVIFSLLMAVLTSRRAEFSDSLSKFESNDFATFLAGKLFHFFLAID